MDTAPGRVPVHKALKKNLDGTGILHDLHTWDVNDLVEERLVYLYRQTSWTMGNGLCVTTGMSTTS